MNVDLDWYFLIRLKSKKHDIPNFKGALEVMLIDMLFHYVLEYNQNAYKDAENLYFDVECLAHYLNLVGT